MNKKLRKRDASIRNFLVVGAIYLIAAFTQPVTAPAGETITESVKQSARELKADGKEVGRSAKDETCKLVNGELECAVEKAKSGVKNVGDDVKNSAKAAKEKAD